LAPACHKHELISTVKQHKSWGRMHWTGAEVHVGQCPMCQSPFAAVAQCNDSPAKGNLGNFIRAGEKSFSQEWCPSLWACMWCKCPSNHETEEFQSTLGTLHSTTLDLPWQWQMFWCLSVYHCVCFFLCVLGRSQFSSNRKMVLQSCIDCSFCAKGKLNCDLQKRQQKNTHFFRNVQHEEM